MSRDRRRKKRVDLSDRSLTFSARAGDNTVRGRVLDLSEQAFRVLLDGEFAPAPKTDLTDSQLHLDGSPPLPLGALTVKKLAADKADFLHLTVRAADEETTVTLWQAVTQLETLNSLPTAEPPSPEHTELPKIPARGQYSETARQERLQFARTHSGVPMLALKDTRVEPERLTSNVENMIGAIEVPVGLAGPLLFRGKHANGVIYAPLATTEGTLVASCSRGATAMSRSGGVTTRVLGQRMMRVPLFVTTSLDGAYTLANWIRDHVDELREQVGLVSRHADLVSVVPAIIGRQVHVYFTYETGDAAGQNMTTATTWQACQWLLRQVKHLRGVEVEHFIIEANMSSDKKVTFQSFIAGRGIRVAAECFLDGEIMRQTLKVTPQQLADAHAGFLAGSIHVGMVGFNIDVANIIAAIFTATGQDIACVHESSVAQLHLQPVEGGMQASLVLPSLIIGTVGGGTHLPGQHDLLQMMDCAGAGKVYRLAEIIAGYCLALDLSTLAAITSGEFATAHERLGRNRPVEFFTHGDLNREFFQACMRKSLDAPNLEVQSVEPIEMQMGSSIITELTARKVDKLVGHIPLQLRYRDGHRDEVAQVVTKVKPLDDEVVLMINSLAAMCGPRLASVHDKFKHRTGMAGCHVRELAIYDQRDERFTRNAPKVYGTHCDHQREAYIAVLEKLDNMVLMDTADHVRGWTRANVEVALRGIAEVHSIWYGREAELLDQPWLGETPTADGMVEMTELWDALSVHAREEFPELVTRARRERTKQFIAELPTWWPALEAMPRTLVHNDFNPRNVALRDVGPSRSLCAYDWELATLHVPQHDLAEFLCFVLREGVRKRNVDYLIEVHRKTLEDQANTAIDPATWREGYRLALRDLAINRFGLYLMAHTFRHYAFLERTINTLWWLIELEEGAPEAATR